MNLFAFGLRCMAAATVPSKVSIECLFLKQNLCLSLLYLIKKLSFLISVKESFISLSWQTLAIPKYARTYLESDVVSPLSRRQTMEWKQVGLKEKQKSYFSVQGLRSSKGRLSC